MLIAAVGLLAPAHAFDHDHKAFAAVLDGAVVGNTVDYGLIEQRKPALKGYLEQVANANVRSFTPDQQLAFYVNAYNALTLDLIVTNGKPASIRDIQGGQVWDQSVFPVGRERLTLNQIEHGKVRELEDGRIHAVVNCASKGCPPLPATPMTAGQVQGHLDAGARQWTSTNAFALEGKVLRLSKIFQWYAEDFTGMEKGTASDEDMKKAALTFIGTYGTVPEHASVEWGDYDWSLNAKE